MSRTDELRALLATVKVAEDGGGEIDARLRCLLLAPAGSTVEQSRINGAWCIFDGIDSRGRPRLWEGGRIPHSLRQGGLSTSLDGTAELVQHMLPGWSWEVRRSGHGDFAQARLWDPRVQPAPGANAYTDHASGVPALALIAALLSALLAQEAEHGTV